MIRSARLSQLIDELHEVNEWLAKAATPLKHHAELDGGQRQHIAAEMRAGLARWEIATRRIDEALRPESEA